MAFETLTKKFMFEKTKKKKVTEEKSEKMKKKIVLHRIV